MPTNDVITDDFIVDNKQVVDRTTTTETITVTDDIKTDLLNQFSSKYNGKTIDDNGNLLDEAGKVIKTLAELTAELEESETSIEIDGSKYKIDDKGNAVNEKGEIVKTKEEVEDLKTPLPLLISKKTGNILKDEQGNVINFPDNIEGVIERENKLIEMISANVKSSAVLDYLSEHSELIPAFNHYIKNGTLNGFTNETVDYSKIELTKDDVDTHVKYIIDAELKRGNTKERAEQIANYIKNDNKTFEEAKLALDYLKTSSEKANLDLVKAEQDRLNIIATQEKEFKNNVAKTLASKKIKDITLPDKFKTKIGDKEVELTHKDIIDYMFTPRFQDKAGNTYTYIEKRMMEIEANPEEFLMHNLNIILGRDLSKLVKENVQTQQVDSLYKRLKGIQGTSNTTRKPDNSETQVVF